MSRRRLPVTFYLIAAAVVVGDQVAKWMVVQTLKLGQTVVLIPRLLRLTRSENPGAAFGMLPTATAGLVVAGLFIIVILLLYGRRVATCRPLWIGLALQVGGAAGNLIDRVFRGSTILHGRVVDYIDVQLTRTYHWPTFNLADMAITAGAILIAYCLVTGKDAAAEQAHEADAV